MLSVFVPVVALSVVLSLVVSSPAQAAAPVTLTFTTDFNHFTVPAGVTSLQITARGGSGGSGGLSSESETGGIGGSGSLITGNLPVTPGQVLGVAAGRGGQDGFPSDTGNCDFASGGQGLDDGGDGGQGTGCDGDGGGGGGGDSFVSSGDTPVLLAAGGGGGGGSTGIAAGGDGGSGGPGSASGGDGNSSPGSGGARGGQPGNVGGQGGDSCSGCDSGGGGGGGGGQNGGTGGRAGDRFLNGGGGGAGTDFVSSSISNPVISVSPAGPGANGLVTITYTPPDTTTTDVSCSPGSVVAGQSSTCTVTVTDTETTSPSTPTGTVSFSSSGAGAFSGAPCTLQGSGVAARCSVSYRPTAVGTGSHTITASYGGDLPGQGHGAHQPSSGSQAVSVSLRTSQTHVSCSPLRVAVEHPTTCTATVTDTTTAGSAITPTGTVAFSVLDPDAGLGRFSDGGQCTLHGSGASATCSLTYTPSAVGDGIHTVLGTYGGDHAHSGGLGTSGFQFVLVVAAHSTSTSVSCSPSTVGGGQSTTCTATVTDTETSGQFTPSGTVAFTSSGSGSFSGSPCTLSGSEASAGCSVSYTPTAGASGSQTITASYSGDATHTGSAHQAELQVGVAPGAPTITGLANGDARVAVSFTDANPGSSPITSYEVTATNLTQPTVPRVTAKGPESPITVTGLTNGDTYVFTVTATNADGTSPPSAPSERLNVGVPPVIQQDPTDGVVGQAYSSRFVITGAPPPTVTQISGELPPGLTLASDGALTGTPTTAGSYEFTVKADNHVGTADASVTVTIAPALSVGEPPPAPHQHNHRHHHRHHHHHHHHQRHYTK